VPRKSKDQFTESMVKFGQFLKFLRCPSIHEYKLKEMDRHEGKYGLSGLSDWLESDQGSMNELFPDEQLPNNFRDLQRQARRFRVKMYSLREMAQILDISKNTLHDYEQGKRYPSVEFVYDYCEALKISVDLVLEFWLKCHPQENIKIQAEENLSEYYFHQLSVHSQDEQRVKAMQTFERALLHAVFENEVSIDPSSLRQICKTFANIIDSTLGQGLLLEPKNIDKVTSREFARIANQSNL
jgi:transcriptional regulator with XRE-family HTH domain